LPKAGDVFAMPLADRRWGACRVLSDAPPAFISKGNCFLVAACDWIGDAVPTPDQPALSKILVLTHHNWGRHPEICWVSGPPPRTFRHIGSVAGTAAELKLHRNAVSSWLSFPMQVLLQWRWDHDRRAVLAEDVLKQATEAQRLRDDAAQMLKKLNATTLAKLRRQPLFRSWEGSVPRPGVKASRQLFMDAIDSLAALGRKPNRGDAVPILRRLIEGFNDLDERHGHFIETMEREDICEQFYRLAHVAGVETYGKSDLADKWRDW
jgi:hypothetical protein